MTEARRVYNLQNLSLEELNFLFSQISDRLDQMEGFRDKPDFKSDVGFGGHRGVNAQEAADSADLITLDQLQQQTATTVTDETDWGIAPAVGSMLSYAREDHTHGSLDDAPSDGSTYGRKSGLWEAIPDSAVIPVGYIMINTSGSNPATDLGYGTWTLLSSGSTLVT